MAARQVSPRLLILLALTVAAAVVWLVWRPGGPGTPGGVSGTPRNPAAAGQADPAVPPSLGLEAMDAERAAPTNKRDLFRFGQAAPDPATSAGGEGQRRTPSRPTPPVQTDPQPAAPQLEPIPLRYVVFAETPGTGRVAGLSDGRFIYNGREGDVIEGKWRIVKIGPEAVIIERVDGTGRQTLRLAGG